MCRVKLLQRRCGALRSNQNAFLYPRINVLASAPSLASSGYAMKKRGILYVCWGEEVESALQLSLQSLKRYHPELPVHVERLPAESSYLDKARMMEMSPFEETLFLDADTVVLGNLDFGF